MENNPSTLQIKQPNSIKQYKTRIKFEIRNKLTSFGHRDAHEGGNSGDRSRFALFLAPGTKIAHGAAAAKFSVNDSSGRRTLLSSRLLVSLVLDM